MLSYHINNDDLVLILNNKPSNLRHLESIIDGNEHGCLLNNFKVKMPSKQSRQLWSIVKRCKPAHKYAIITHTYITLIALTCKHSVSIQLLELYDLHGQSQMGYHLAGVLISYLYAHVRIAYMDSDYWFEVLVRISIPLDTKS